MLRTLPKLRGRIHWLLPIAGLGLLAWAVHALVQVHSTPARSTLTCAAGGHWTRRYEIATSLAEYAAPRGLDLELTETSGAEDSLNRLNSGEIDVALVSGGIDTERYPNIRQVATIGTEPLHLFVRPEVMAAHREGAPLLRGRRVNIGEPGSSSHALTLDILSFAGLCARDAQGNGDFTQLEMSPDELVEKTRAIQRASAEKRAELVAELPDAFVIVNPLPSRTVQAVLAVAEYELVPLPFGEAYRVNGVRQAGHATSIIDRRLVEQTTVPAYTYRVARPAIPETDCVTLGVKSLIVVRHDIRPAALRQLVETIYESRFHHEMAPENLLDAGTEYPAHLIAMAFLRSRQPMVVKDFVEITQKLLSALGAFSAGAIAVLGYYRRRKAQQPDTYLADLGRIERLAHGHETPSDPDLPRHELLKQLKAQLTELKQAAIDDYAHARFKGENTFPNLLALIADTRREIDRLLDASTSSLDLRVIPRRRIDSPTRRVES